MSTGSRWDEHPIDRGKVGAGKTLHAQSAIKNENSIITHGIENLLPSFRERKNLKPSYALVECKAVQRRSFVGSNQLLTGPTAVAIWLAFAVAAALPAKAMARPELAPLPSCVDAFEPDQSPNPKPALDPMRRFSVDLGPYRLFVPWAYFAGGPRANLPSCKLSIKRLAIRFRFGGGTSFPTGEIDYSYSSNALWEDRPADVVQVQAIHFYKETPEDYFDPSLRYRNTVRAAETSGSIRQVDGLDEIKFDGSRTDWYLSTTETDAFISCYAALCTGFTNMKDLHLSAHITLKEQAVRDIRKVDKVLRSLIENWQNAN